VVKVSISALIYRSPDYADWCYEGIKKYTPLLETGLVEFYYVANDPTDDLLQHLQDKGYPHYVNLNPPTNPEILFKKGIGPPEYIHRVYRGWNSAIQHAKGEIVVLLNSDNYVSPHWLENLLKYLKKGKNIICSQLIERDHPKHGVFPGAYKRNFGQNPKTFKEDAFLKSCKKLSEEFVQDGGSFMPCAFYKEDALRAGLYPEGNLSHHQRWETVESGDHAFFRNLDELNVEHFTAMDSIVYHTKEGEMDE
jgi:hypothetical protein